MSYEALRQFADSIGLGAMVAVYLALTLWAFRPGARRHHEHAANMIFAEPAEAAVAERKEQDNG